ncbi:MAG: hypothetical protein LUD69_07270 [Oscillospiraceae bacterium]|nr:hypothetical protein [Oscillospiraceae bacterium]
MKAFLKKLASRKFLAAVAGFIAGLAMVFGLDESIVSSVAGAVVSIGSVVTYIITEGCIDAAAVGEAVQTVQETVGLLSTSEDGTDGETEETTAFEKEGE